MNCQFYYKGQTVTITCVDNASIKKIYELSIPKFKQHLAQELRLLDNQVKFRLKRRNGLLDSNDSANSVLVNKDLIIIEPENQLPNSNQNCHTPKRYKNISNTENDFKPSELQNSKPNFPPKPTPQMEYVLPNKKNIYQKYDQSHNPSKENPKASNFSRSELRRSLGAGIAYQYDLESSKNKGNYYGSVNNTYRNEVDSSDSSISDLYPKPSNKSKAKLNRNMDLPMKGINNEVSSSYLPDDDKKFPMSKSAPASPTKPVPPLRSPQTHLTMINVHNVRTIGKKIKISILKKPNGGLGFTIVTRDNQVLYGSGADLSSSVVILVNKILSNGGAADDGRLRPGDRIIEVDNVPVTSARDTTEKLKTIPVNTTVELLISRIDNDESEFNPPSSKLPKTSQLTFEISLNSKNKESQQLGLNIHYRNEKDDPLLGTGIYIHSILSNSLASQQGNLHKNDKLVGVNGQSLANLSVEQTINLLKTAMQNNSFLAITVMRESMNEDPSNLIVTNNSKFIINNENIPKSEITRCILPDKIKIDSKSKKKSKHRHQRNSSSDSCSQNEFDPSHSLTSNSFVREGPSRRSMSEKRKFCEDPSQYQVYQKRIGDITFEANERQYSTLPTASHKKKQDKSPPPPPLPNKTTMKPSQIKIKSVLESGPRMTNVTPNRSVSLRDSPNTPNFAHKSRSPKHLSQTPSHELQPVFNREMNSSFKKAVQRSLPDANEHTLSTQYNNSLSRNTGKPSVSADPTTQSEKDFQNSNQSTTNHRNEKLPRSHSVKTTEKKKSFNIKDFLPFQTNPNHSVKYKPTNKSDTFPPEKRGEPQLPNYQSTNPNDLKHRPYSPFELPPEMQYSNDSAIIDSTKRVLEWQKKNADVISKENKNNKIYHPINSTNNDARIQKTKPDLNLRSQSTKKNTTQYHYETDPYDTIDGTLSSPVGNWNPKSARSAPRSANNTIYGITGAISTNKNGALAPRSNSIIPYQTNSNRKPTSIGNDLYATVNKPNKKESTIKQSPNISQVHRNKYKF